MRALGPVVDPVPCSGCGKLIDPLRAGHVAIFDGRFHFFCGTNPCRASFLGEEVDAEALAAHRAQAAQGSDDESQRRKDELSEAVLPALGPGPDPDLGNPPPAPGDERSLVEPIARTILTDDPPRIDAPDVRDIGALLLVIAVVAGALAVALVLAGDTRLVVGARIILSTVGAAMLLGRAVTTARDAGDPHPAPVLTSTIGGLVVATWAALGQDRALSAEAASLAGLLVTAAGVSAWLAEVARHQVSGERAWVSAALTVVGGKGVARGAGGDSGKGASGDVRPGEAVIVEEGAVVPVDLTVTGPEVEVLPWIGATTPARRRTGDAVVAGARVLRGRLTGACTWAGLDRAFARILLDPRRRADMLAPIAQSSRALAERWAIAAAIVGAICAAITRHTAIEVCMTALAVHAGLANTVIATIASTHVARGILLGLRRGIVYRSADAWDRAGRVVVAAFCARGTLLLGEPELTELESTGPKVDPAVVLSLAAGAERTEEHPVAAAIVRAARMRGVRPDGVRNPNLQPGLGVTAVSASGEDLCVGSRALMMQQRISIAAAEARITELESLGRTVLLVAIGSRLIGLLGLQDGLRPGARAAVQHLLDAQVEPVLISGDARETCEAIGRSLDIDHIRPEVLPGDRGAEVRRLIDAGMSVAVLGHPGIDDAALAAADVAVALGAAGSTPGDFAVTLASNDVRDASLALALAHRTRIEARAGLALAAAPGMVGGLAIAFGILPPAFAPIAALLGGAMAVVHLRRGA